MWLTQLLDRNRQFHGGRTALADSRQTLTWAELDDSAAALAGRLAGRGVRHGDRVAVLSRDRVEVLQTYFALGRLGALFVPLDPTLVPAEVAETVQHAKAAAVVGEADLVGRLGPAAGPVLSFDELGAGPGRAAGPPPDHVTGDDVRADDPLAILYTSATTGHPKGVVVDHRSVKDIALGWMAAAAPPAGSVLVAACPLFHGTVVLTLAHLAAGATVVVPDPGPAGIAEAAHRHRATHLWLVPETLRTLLGHLDDAPGRELPGSLTEILYGAAPMPVGLYARAAARLGCGFRQVYGLTEAGGPVATLAPAEHPAPGAELPEVLPVGRVTPGTSVRIADGAGRPVPPGTRGEIRLRGDGRMRGYWRDPAATAAAFAEGWLRTGDRGFVDADGLLHVVDRLTDLIIRGGINVYPAEIERVLREHPDVADAAVVPVADPDEGEVPYALVVPGPGAVLTREDVMAHLRARMSPAKRPKDVQIVGELPRGASGKVQRLC
jgi:acyl-CoA synthetase (AMP-forming)/AMP-acid ligase II